MKSENSTNFLFLFLISSTYIKVQSKLNISFKKIFLISFFSFIGLSASAQLTDVDLSVSSSGKEDSYKPYYFTGFSLASYDLKLLDVGGGRPTSYNFVTFNYRLQGFGEKIVFRLPYMVNGAGFDQFGDNDPTYHRSEVALDDPIIGYVNSNMPLMPFDIDTYFESRFYIPLSRQSQQLENRIGRFRLDLIFSKYLYSQKLTLVLLSQFNYYLHSRTTYEADVELNDATGEGFNPTTNTKLTQSRNDLSLLYAFDYQYSLGVNLGTRIETYNESERRTKDNNIEYYFGPQFIANIPDVGRFIFSLQDNANRNNRAEFGQFKKENLGFALLAFYRFDFLN